MKDINKIDWLNVDSSQITGANYVGKEKRMYLKFRNKSVYVYEDVSLEEFEEFMSAPSQGKYFYANIKNVKSFKKL